ncbi:hypothetical protein FORC37_p070 (plasmid) [Vibrio vulnificus]|nr:hypothetical protein FORC37_p017 [Vibrio vulnificus]ASC60195.1 hypothetical protein FORC37_p070 [Vibrio vulnificus]
MISRGNLSQIYHNGEFAQFVSYQKLVLAYKLGCLCQAKNWYNKAFKRDSCRVAFLVCSEFWW